MQNLSDIKHRIKGISETRQITGAMETISIAKMRKALAKFNANQQYFHQIRATIKDIVLHTKDVTHKYLNVRNGKRAVYIVIASDKGLAGSYNHNVLNAAWDSISKRDEQISVFTVGHLAREFFQMRNIDVDIEFSHLTRDPTIHDAANIVDNIISLYNADMMDEVYVVYTGLESTASVKPHIIKLLPLVQEEVIDVDSEEHDEEYFREVTYDPSPDEVLANLVPQYLVGVLYGALVQAVASEHSSRMLAMSNATKNASEMLDKLNVMYNRARQESVTNELTEIITSSMGVSK